MKRITIIAYRENGEDTCMGQRMERIDSDFVIEHLVYPVDSMGYIVRSFLQAGEKRDGSAYAKPEVHVLVDGIPMYAGDAGYVLDTDGHPALRVFEETWSETLVVEAQKMAAEKERARLAREAAAAEVLRQRAVAEVDAKRALLAKLKAELGEV